LPVSLIEVQSKSPLDANHEVSDLIVETKLAATDEATVVDVEIHTSEVVGERTGGPGATDIAGDVEARPREGWWWWRWWHVRFASATIGAISLRASPEREDRQGNTCSQGMAHCHVSHLSPRLLARKREVGQRVWAVAPHARN
jgi:hypothetical protein